MYLTNQRIWFGIRIITDEGGEITNEKLYENEIERITKECKSLHPAVRNGKPVPCIDTPCYCCDFYEKSGHCSKEAYKTWLKSEAKPESLYSGFVNGHPVYVSCCPKCGNKLDDRDEFCHRCGQRIDWSEDKEEK